MKLRSCATKRFGSLLVGIVFFLAPTALSDETEELVFSEDMAPREYVLQVLGSTPESAGVSDEELYDAKRALIAGLGVLGEVEILEDFASDESQDSLIRLSAACFLARLGRHEKAAALAERALRDVIDDVRGDEGEEERRASALLPSALYGSVIDSFKNVDAPWLSVILLEVALDPNLPILWRRIATMAVAVQDVASFETLIEEAFRPASDDVELNVFLACVAVELGVRESGMIDYLISADKVDADRRKAIYEALFLADLNSQQRNRLRDVFNSYEENGPEKTALAAVLAESADEDDSSEYLQYLRNRYAEAPLEVLDIDFLPRRVGLEFWGEASKSASLEVRQAATYQAGRSVDWGRNSFGEVSHVFDTAAEDGESVHVPPGMCRLYSNEELLEVAHSLVQSQNDGLRLAGLYMLAERDLLAPPDALSEIIESSDDPCVLALAYRVAHLHDPSTFGPLMKRESFSRNNTFLLAHLARSLSRIRHHDIQLSGGYRGGSYAAPERYVPPKEEDRQHWKWHPMLPYRTFWQAFAWESLVGEGLVRIPEDYMSTPTAIPTARWQKVDEFIDLIRFDDISEKQSRIIQTEGSDYNLYDRSCLALQAWFLAKDHGICAERREMLVQIPFMVRRANGDMFPICPLIEEYATLTAAAYRSRLEKNAEMVDTGR